MKILHYKNAAGALALGIAMLSSGSARSQPMDDRVLVDMPYSTTIGDKKLEAGSYVIQRMSSSGSSRVLLFYSDNGMKFETSATAMPAYDPNTARDTKIVLTRVGDDYYYSKIWIEGKQYGYEFPLPKVARERQNELSAVVTVPAGSSAAATEKLAPATVPDTTQAPEPAPVIAETEQAGVEDEPEVEEPRAAAPAITAPDEPAPPADLAELAQSADREMDQNPPPVEQLPATSAGWLAMMLGAGGLFGTGLILLRKK